ncbi:transcription/translation regulatory transformer protein RfaH [Shewanella canadensis]|uniref:Transcription antitermination protein RfaH n=1 Tax=Shewanella canadensis TaxID=271096 RepID=A0A431WKV3_9GAMM|nr:transcription/translation regulatory transformer protein RfaH [Shewanella canadensis]RTR35974.1 transcription/translation regulatory transformer protein RfaH [Shewanella canadensis]
MKAWYLLYCKPRGEARAQQNLALQQIDTYLPVIATKAVKAGRSSVRTAPLFPCYLFAYFDPQVTSVSRIHSTRGVSRIVGCKELMTSIDDEIINAIKLRERELVAELSESADVELNQLKPAVEPEFTEGDKVTFTEGPFVDLDGIFAEKSGDKRCHILFEIMGQQKRVTVPKSSIKPK